MERSMPMFGPQKRGPGVPTANLVHIWENFAKQKLWNTTDLDEQALQTKTSEILVELEPQNLSTYCLILKISL